MAGLTMLPGRRLTTPSGFSQERSPTLKERCKRYSGNVSSRMLAMDSCEIRCWRFTKMRIARGATKAVATLGRLVKNRRLQKTPCLGQRLVVSLGRRRGSSSTLRVSFVSFHRHTAQKNKAVAFTLAADTDDGDSVRTVGCFLYILKDFRPHGSIPTSFVNQGTQCTVALHLLSLLTALHCLPSSYAESVGVLRPIEFRIRSPTEDRIRKTGCLLL
jgi:hypothetical protein